MSNRPGNHEIINTLFLLLLFHLCMRNSLANECPNSCTCHDGENRHVNCSNKLLLNPPKTSTSTLTLDLSHNALGPTLNASFVQMRNLSLIDLSQNALTLLLDCTFSGMLGLRTVRLNGNRLTSLSDDLFTDANKVEHLDLSHNLFSELPQDVFKSLPELKTLDVSHNLLARVTLGNRFQVPRHIQMIDLSHNIIQAIRADTFEIASYWQPGIDRSLNLAFCQITSIDEGAITKIPNLHDLDLSGNSGVSMETLTRLIKELETGARNLDRLSLAHMNLTTLVPFFTQVSQLALKFLNASFNKINDVPANTFSTIRSLRVLDLSRNAVSMFADGLSDLVNLRVLNISHNQVESFQGDQMTDLSNLHTLDLSHNKLVDSNTVNFAPLTKLNYLNVNNNFLASVVLPSNTSHLQFVHYHSNRITQFSGLDDAAMLEVLDLSDNDLASISSFLFKGVKFLKIANFSKNSIESIDQRAFLPQSPLVIDLSHNFLKEIRYSNWVATQKLYLRHNSIGQIDSQAFNGMTGLEELDLSRNNLGVVHEDLFHHLTNLRHLDMSYNGLNKLPWLDVFRNLEQLETLDLGHNNISELSQTMLLPLSKVQTLYLQANSLQTIFPRVFRDATQLKVIDLSNNPFDCVCDMLAFKDWLRRTKISVFGLYTNNSTAYYCRAPPNRAGIHVLRWEEEGFECNRSVLYLVIVCSAGAFLIILGIAGSVGYRCFRNWKRDIKRKRRLKDEEEDRKKRAKKVDIVRLSNQEIAEAIKEAIERKGRHRRRNDEIADRHNFLLRSGQTQKSAGQDKRRRFSEHKEEDKGAARSGVSVRKERSRERHYERMKKGERAAEELDKQRGQSSSRHPDTSGDKNLRETGGERRPSDNSSLDPYLYDRRPVPLSHPYEDHRRESQDRDHDDRMPLYKRDSRYRPSVGPDRNNGPFIISPASTLPNGWDKRDAWTLPRGMAYQGYRQPRGRPQRMDGYLARPVRDVDVPRQMREARIVERVVDRSQEYYPSYPRKVEEVELMHQVRQGEDDAYHRYYDNKRSQSYNFLTQDYPSKIPYLKRDRAQREYESIQQTSRGRGVGTRAVSQPFLATESAHGWL